MHGLNVSSTYSFEEQLLLLDSPSVWEEVDFNIRIPGPAVFPGRQVFGAQDGDDQLMTDFVVPEFDLRGEEWSMF